MTERTLSIIKPDAVSKSVIGEIYSRFEKAGLKIIAAKMVQLDEDSAGGFYAEHQGSQCQARLGLFRNEYGCERPDEATAGDTEKDSSKE